MLFPGVLYYIKFWIISLLCWISRQLTFYVFLYIRKPYPCGQLKSLLRYKRHRNDCRWQASMKENEKKISTHEVLSLFLHNRCFTLISRKILNQSLLIKPVDLTGQRTFDHASSELVQLRRPFAERAVLPFVLDCVYRKSTILRVARSVGDDG